MRHVVENRWGGESRSDVFGSLATTLRAPFPAKWSYRVLEDNDASGYQTKVFRKAKDEAQIPAVHDSNRDA